VSELLVKPGHGQEVMSVDERSGLAYVGFEVLALQAGVAVTRETTTRELCIVVVEGQVLIDSEHGRWTGLGNRTSPWGGDPDAAYLPPGSSLTIEAPAAAAEVALCWAPAPNGGAEPRVLSGAEIVREVRGSGPQERYVYPILMGDRDAESLLVCEVRTPSGHWSSYPPHKHDQMNLPRESQLEETYYHRVRPEQGFGLQRVYTDDRSIDEAISFSDRDCVLVPRGYHTVSAPPGYDLYYLNVMAGPDRTWAVADDPDHSWAKEVGR
jgi:5-deoxy-glucuronate isomerase